MSYPGFRAYFYLLVNIPMYGYMTVCLFSHQLKNVFITPHFWQLCFGYKHSPEGIYADISYQTGWVNI